MDDPEKPKVVVIVDDDELIRGSLGAEEGGRVPCLDVRICGRIPNLWRREANSMFNRGYSYTWEVGSGTPDQTQRSPSADSYHVYYRSG